MVAAAPPPKNYITPSGFARLQAELRHLLRVERPKVVEVVSWAAGNGDRSENGDYIYGKKRLREIDRRIRFLTKRLEMAEVVDPAAQPRRDQIFFGATVTYVREDDTEVTVTIVGTDETDHPGPDAAAVALSAPSAPASATGSALASATAGPGVDGAGEGGDGTDTDDTDDVLDDMAEDMADGMADDHVRAATAMLDAAGLAGDGPDTPSAAGSSAGSISAATPVPTPAPTPADQGRRISWISPIARALLKARVGDLVTVRTPAGAEELEIIAIRYPTPRAP
ncbi:MAG: transcription elongation factor GreB [Pseudomonadota bacterium]|jgi:transcription elongation factor GreB